ncbi:MAG: hypothetical protein Q4F72_01440, partial [Desulfovibrionaceae bacterium]|nr:hypothetical protein [Desulfovibrionaceae bacterium]
TDMLLQLEFLQFLSAFSRRTQQKNRHADLANFSVPEFCHFAVSNTTKWRAFCIIILTSYPEIKIRPGLSYRLRSREFTCSLPVSYLQAILSARCRVKQAVILPREHKKSPAG